MFPTQSTSSPLTPGDRTNRSGLPHSHSQSSMPFSASTSSSVGWGATNSPGLNDPFTPSRSHYQPGFLMSMTQNNTTPTGGQLIEEPPIIPTKFNPTASRTSPSEFGLESMFERTKPRRQRQTTSVDDDAPPTMSITDMMDEVHVNPFQRRDAQSGSPALRPRPVQQVQPQPNTSQIVYLNIFGYPLDCYESVVKLFQGLGDTTEPEPSENGLWFTLGFRNSWEAERALRRNGKIMDEMYMIGVAKANGSTVTVDVPMDTSGPRPGSLPGSPPTTDSYPSNRDSLQPAFKMNRSTSFGKPLTVEPSTAAFKTPTNKAKAQPTTTTPIRVQANEAPQGSALSKISDMIFGW
ncbi:hypothetical protein Clacol_005541 [Clathrus columnatus]|uniref:RRM Nup35-type domain-containing protein n=1 Tax=Clathrus columnatus TaxID=1419009 RepID=A0AAV5A9N0_9AGAM|nr:hypothetical protein Clacol_005541 [Clathrus columnatus]